jgi:DNA-binding CsgD family transcriptional regulator
MQCLLLLAEGNDPRAIASMLDLSVDKVEQLLDGAAAGLGARRRLQAVLIAARLGCTRA